MNVAGYFKAVLGVGEHARQLVAGLESQGIPVRPTTLHPHASPEDESLGVRGTTEDKAAFNLLCVNADVIAAVAKQLVGDFYSGGYTIGYWAWEVSAFPPEWLGAFSAVNEVWVGSAHVHDAVAAAATVPVVTIPQPVSLPERSESPAPPAGLPEGFRFLFAFDYFSVFERKNPLAAVEAFTRAFEPGSGAALIVKSLNHDHDLDSHERLRLAAAAHPDVHLIEERLTPSERDGLFNACDCYLSLHRAEGFGYTMAEAMWEGKPVIATAYSGNLDYMTPENSYLVDYSLVPIGEGHAPYPAGGEWAEPDVEHAARLMREVFEHPEEAARRGERAAADIRRTHSPEAAGRAMATRLRLLMATPGAARRPRLRQDLRRAADRLGGRAHQLRPDRAAAPLRQGPAGRAQEPAAPDEAGHGPPAAGGRRAAEGHRGDGRQRSGAGDLACSGAAPDRRAAGGARAAALAQRLRLAGRHSQLRERAGEQPPQLPGIARQRQRDVGAARPGGQRPAGPRLAGVQLVLQRGVAARLRRPRRSGARATPATPARGPPATSTPAPSSARASSPGAPAHVDGGAPGGALLARAVPRGNGVLVEPLPPAPTAAGGRARRARPARRGR